jgi:hypothetical protein
MVVNALISQFSNFLLIDWFEDVVLWSLNHGFGEFLGLSKRDIILDFDDKKLWKHNFLN